MLKTHYTILGIPENATQLDIKSAYRSGAILYHPDKNNGSIESQKQFIAVNQAYCILSDENKRVDYDRKLAIYRENIKIQQEKAKREAFETFMRTPQNTQTGQPDESLGFIIVSMLKGALRWVLSALPLLLVITIISMCNSRNSPTTTSTSNYVNFEQNSTNNDYNRNASLPTGAKPYVNTFGAGHYDASSLSRIEIRNGAMSDAVVMLYNVKNNLVYRHAYIEANRNYTLSELPEGLYDMKTYYGNGWNGDKDNGKNFPNGGFEYNESFSHSEASDYFKIYFEQTYDGMSYPTYSVTLYEVKHGNMSTEKISKNNFFN